jgi:hypothetical protein
VELGDDHAVEVGRHLVEDRLEEVVGHRPGRLHALEGVDDRRGFGRADEDRQVALPALFTQQHDGLVGGHFDPHSHQRHLDHGQPSGSRTSP